MTVAVPGESAREKALSYYRRKLVEHRGIDARLKEAREKSKAISKEYDKAENDLKALQSVGQIVGDVLKQLTDDHCKLLSILYSC
uniref:Putative 26s protease regulatory subunit S10b n=1 Tax=Schistosoma mansoni TaxID=6183 RepID=A0A5K4EAG2_SCHMA